MGSMLLTHFSQLLLCNKLDVIPNGIHFFLTVDERNIAPVSHCHFFSEPSHTPPAFNVDEVWHDFSWKPRGLHPGNIEHGGQGVATNMKDEPQHKVVQYFAHQL